MDSGSGLKLDVEGGNSADFEAAYQHCLETACCGQHQQAKAGLFRLLQLPICTSLRAKVHNDLGVLATLNGQAVDAKAEFEKAVKLDPKWRVAQDNLRLINLENEPVTPTSPISVPQRVAIVSLLFNWPSTGGGTVHTVETGRFLRKAGYSVRHFYAEYPEWGVGSVTEPTQVPSHPLRFDAADWNILRIQDRFRAAVEQFKPDWVIITDSWNSKAILAEAVGQFRYLLRIAAQECLCPLNNVRLLFDQGSFLSCPKHQFASPVDCCRCVQTNGRFSGGLHRAERELVQYGTSEYDRSLRSAFANAEAILVVNPLIGAIIGPYARRVCVIPSGFDPERFRNTLKNTRRHENERIQLLFAGLVNEPMKGFDVLHEACQQLWRSRQDFELLATADPIGQVDGFTRYVGWQSQASLPEVMHAADIIVVPTVAEEALGRTAVEAMGASRPVIASKIGGLQFTVAHGATGLLFTPGDVDQLQRQIAALLDDADLRHRFGRAGRQKFDEEFTWDSIIRRSYVPLLGQPEGGSSEIGAQQGLELG